MHKKEILFVRPKTKICISKLPNLPPLGLLMLASLTNKKEYNITLIDEDTENIDYSKHYDIVCITILTHNKQRAFKIASNFKKKQTLIIMGGSHVTLCQDDVNPHCDCIVTGCGEFVWDDLLKDYKNGRLKKIYNSKKNGFTEVKIDWSLISKKRYLFKNMLITSRGCKNKCDFCQIPEMFGNEVKNKPIEYVVREISNFKKDGFLSKWVIFCDDNLVTNYDYALKLFEALIPLNIKFIAQCSIDIGKDNKLLDLAQKAGLKMIYVGIETTNQKILDKVHKPNKSSNYKTLIDKINNRGILITGSFIIGLPKQSNNDILSDLQFAKENTTFVLFNPMRYLPKTKLEINKSEEVYVSQTDEIPNLPSLMDRCYKEYYSLNEIMKRMLRLFKSKIGITMIFVFMYISLITHYSIIPMEDINA